MSAPNPLIQPLIDHLHSDGRLRVWSVVITIFGDYVQPHGGTIAMTDLQSLLGAMNVESGAVRTAMSRLAKEGWVMREKQGRNSFYRLSDTEEQRFIPAAQKIYRVDFSPDPKTLLVAIAPNAVGHGRETQNALLSSFGGMQVRNGVGLFADPNETVRRQISNADFFVFEGDVEQLPNWAIEKLDLQTLAQEYRALANRLQHLAVSLSSLREMNGLDALCARTLLIHDWRRLILKQPPLPKQLLPADWPGAECHRLVRDIYLALVDSSELWRECEQRETAQTELARRFKH